jgi:hypothetical protein
VTIPTNDPVRPDIEMTLFATPWTAVQATPPTIDVGRVTKGEEITTTVQLIAHDRRPFRIGHIESNLPEARHSLEHPGEELSLHRLTVVFAGTNRVGPILGELRISTDRIDGPLLNIDIIGQVTGAISTIPSALQIDREEIGKTIKKTLIIRSNRTGTPPVLDNIKATEPWKLISYSKRTLGDGTISLEVTLQLPDGTNPARGELNLTMGSPAKTLASVALGVRGYTPPPPSP